MLGTMGPQPEALSEPAAESAAEVAPHAPAERDRVLTLIMIMEPGDHGRLADLLRAHPELREELIAEATSMLGSDFVGKALAVLANAAEETPAAAAPAAAEAPSAEQASEAASELKITGVDPDGSLAIEFAEAAPEPEAKAEVLAEVVEQAPEEAAAAVEQLVEPDGAAESREPAPEPVPVEEVAATPAAEEQTAEPGWVTRARAYNEAHIALVDEFNDLTGFICALGEDIIDPALVARWQANHDIAPDGRVGAQTVAAARKATANDVTAAPEVAPVPAADGPQP